MTADDLTADVDGSGFLSASIDASGDLANLANGQNVDIYVEGLQADFDFTLSYTYTDADGVEEARADVHMAIADLQVVNAYWRHAGLLAG